MGSRFAPSRAPSAQRPTVDYLRRELDLADMEFRITNEQRTNPHHDEDGLFHDGSPENLLAAAQGRLHKAEGRHSAAVTAYRAASDAPDAGPLWQDMQEALAGHEAAIYAAQIAALDAANGHQAGLAKHQEIINASRAKLMELQGQRETALVA